jgi:hypothetical protein
MNGARAVLRMALGGAVCGSFLGIFGGGLVGALVDGCCADVSIGLDAALCGSALGGLGGMLLGMFLAGRPASRREVESREAHGNRVERDAAAAARLR